MVIFEQVPPLELAAEPVPKLIAAKEVSTEWNYTVKKQEWKHVGILENKSENSMYSLFQKEYLNNPTMYIYKIVNKGEGLLLNNGIPMRFINYGDIIQITGKKSIIDFIVTPTGE